jgi:hypothetical protein
MQGVLNQPPTSPPQKKKTCKIAVVTFGTQVDAPFTCTACTKSASLIGITGWNNSLEQLDKSLALHQVA